MNNQPLLETLTQTESGTVERYICREITFDKQEILLELQNYELLLVHKLLWVRPHTPIPSLSTR